MSTSLDVEDVIAHAYHLEVSSPGIDRPLRRPEDYERFRGQRVRIRTHAPFRGLKEFVGTLVGLRDDLVGIDITGGQHFDIPLDRVAKARLEPDL
jgi:ribosome maturation factor RimP